jgi:hypothetical protein
MKSWCLLATLIILTGCAASYKSIHEVQTASAAMTRDQALEIIADAMLHPPGLCGATGFGGSSFSIIRKARLVGLKDDVVTYKAWVMTSKSGTYVNSYQSETYTELQLQMGLSSIDQIRVQEVAGHAPWCDEPELGTYTVMISVPDNSMYVLQAIVLTVPKGHRDELNQLLAGLMALSPKARVIEGMGL